MAVINIALLAAILPAVFAIPQHAHMGHGLHKRNNLPSGFPTGFPHPSGVPGSAPYPASNATSGVATGTGAGSGPHTITSTLNVVPLPLTHTKYAASSTGGVSEAGASGSPGSGSGSGSGSGESGESGEACGAATVTVTKANTVTVTVGGSNGGSPSEAPVQSSPAAPSVSVSPSPAPYPVGNSSIPVGPSDTGSVGTGAPSIPTQVPVPVSNSAEASSSAPVEAAASATSSPAAVVPTSAASSPASVAPTSAASSPASVAPSSAATPPASVAPTSSVEAHAYNHAPGQQHQSPEAPSSDVSFPSPVVSSSTPPAPAEQATTSAPAPVVSSSASQVASSAPVSSSAAPVKSDSGVKARGLLYGGTPGSTAISNANTFLEGGNGAMGWGWNWDSSPAPQSGAATGNLNVQFVPMLLSAIDVHTSIWDDNSAGHPYLMGFNEPDMTTDKGGSQMDVQTCVSNWMTYMQPKQGASKLISPATTNNLDDTSMGVHYMTNFLEECINNQGCHIDVLAFHYYGEASDIEALKSTVQKYQALQTLHNIPELWITEMAPTTMPTEEQMNAFLEFLDNPSNGVTRYAFNGLNTGTGQALDSGVIKSCYQA